MTSLLRLSVSLAALALLLSVLGCSKPAEETTPPPAPQTGASMYPTNPGGGAPPAAAGSQIPPEARAQMEAKLNDPNVPASAKASIRQQLGQ